MAREKLVDVEQCVLARAAFREAVWAGTDIYIEESQEFDCCGLQLVDRFLEEQGDREDFEQTVAESEGDVGKENAEVKEEEKGKE